MLLAIDPGAATGWALFDSHRLVACGLTNRDQGIALPSPITADDRVLVECPKLRPYGERNPNSILLVARSAGEWAGRFFVGKVEYLLPNDWKGSTKKVVDHVRTWSRLSADELRLVEAGCKGLSPRSGALAAAVASEKGLSAADKRANVLDAIGLGLHGVGR